MAFGTMHTFKAEGVAKLCSELTRVQQEPGQDSIAFLWSLPADQQGFLPPEVVAAAAAAEDSATATEARWRIEPFVPPWAVLAGRPGPPRLRRTAVTAVPTTTYVHTVYQRTQCSPCGLYARRRVGVH